MTVHCNVSCNTYTQYYNTVMLHNSNNSKVTNYTSYNKVCCSDQVTTIVFFMLSCVLCVSISYIPVQVQILCT